MKLIDKDALVAELEDWRDKIKKGIFSIPLTGSDRAYATFEYEILGKVRDFLDTLEVKDACDIWHDVSEKPELERPLLIIMNGTHKDFRKHYRIGCYGKRGNDIPIWVIDCCYSDSFISKWCYISDILKQTLEVKDVDEEIKNAEDHAYFAGSENTREKLIDKACKWLREGGTGWYLTSEYGGDEINFVKLAEDFRKAMEDET